MPPAVLLRAACCLLLLPALGAAQVYPSLDAVVLYAQQRAYRSSQVAWEQVQSEAAAIAATDGEDAAIRYVLKALGDHHSFYAPPRKSAAASAAPASAAASAVVERPAAVLSEVKDPVEGVPVIEVRGWTGSPAQALAAAAALRSQLAAALDEPKCGIVLDFSANYGGNMWPMMVGLGPLFTEGALGYFQDARGSSGAIEKRGQQIYLYAAPHVLNAATDLQPRHGAARIGIAIGPKSGSSGEIVPIMFHGQGNVRFFGRPTAGFSTANSPFPLPNGGVAYITVGTTLDRNRVEFGGALVPDVPSDHAVADAAHWIAAECQRP